MAESRIQNAKKNVFWGMIAKILTLLTPFVTRTIIIYTLGIEYTGLNSLFTSILSVLSLAELGVGSALVFSMYKPIADGNDEKVRALLNVYRKAYRIIGTVILVVGAIISPFVHHLITGDIPEGINLYILFIIYLLSTCLGYFVGAYRTSIFIGSQRVDVIQKITLFVTAIQCAGQIVCLLTYKNFYAFIIWLPISSLLTNAFVVLASKKKYPQYFPSGKLESVEIKTIEKKVAGLVASKIGGVVLSAVDTIVISSFLGLKILGIYNGYFYVITALFGFLSVLYTSLIPSVGNYMATKPKEEVLQLFHIFRYIYMFIVSWSACCLFVLFQPFIILWQGQENSYEFGLVICLTIYYFIHKSADISYVFKEAAGLWWEGKFVPLIAAAINLIVNLILVRIIGLYGIVISTIVSLILIYIPFGSYILFKYYFQDSKEWGLHLLISFLYFIVFSISAAVTFVVCRLVHTSGILELLGKLLIGIFVPLILLFLMTFWQKDFSQTFKYLRKAMFSKRNKESED